MTGGLGCHWRIIDDMTRTDDRLGLGCKVIAACRSSEKAATVLDGYSELGELNAVECDLSKSAPQVGQVNFILHAAAVTTSCAMVELPADVIELSLRGTVAMLSLIRETGARMVVDVDEANSAGYAPDVHLRLRSERLRALGWAPTTSLADSFKQLAAYAVEQGLVESR